MNDPRIGSELAGYRIEALIGRGGMGVVYRAEDLRLGRKVALKLLAPELAENAGFRVRFESESRLAAAIDHPHIIPLYEAGDAEGMLFLIMRFVDGIDLKALLEREGPLSLQRALVIVAQVGGALDAAHARGLVHRDVKPANVLVSSSTGAETSEHCYLTDFGLTKDTSQNKGVTGTGQFVGTIAYVAPEQIDGATQGGATDQYALGCVLYELLTGRPPFERQTELDVMWAHLSDDPPSVTALRPDLPAALDAVLARALAKVPEDRYPSCAAMVAAARSTAPRATVAGRTVIAPAPARGDATRLSPRPGALPPSVAPDAVSPSPTPSPVAERGPARGRAGLVAAAIAAALAAGVAGVVAGGPGERVAPEPANVASTGALSLRFPADWESVPSPPAIPGLRFEDRIALAPRASRGREGLVAGGISSSGARLLAEELERGAAATRDVVRLGAADAFRYSELRATGFTGVVTVYLLLTDKGRVAIACYAASRAPGFDRRCARVAASLQLIEGRALALAPSPQYAAAVSDQLADVARRRAAGRRRLAGASAAGTQARAASALAASYAMASRRVLDLPVPAAARDANKAIAAALRDLGTAYSTAAGAARRRQHPLYRSASRAVLRGERSLRASAETLGELGYTVK